MVVHSHVLCLCVPVRLNEAGFDSRLHRELDQVIALLKLERLRIRLLRTESAVLGFVSGLHF